MAVIHLARVYDREHRGAGRGSDEFRRRYSAELDGRPESWRPLLEAAAAGEVTLLYSSRDDAEHNNAVALREHLTRRVQEAAAPR